MTIGGTTSATNAGTYTVTFTPKGNYKWSDGTTTAKSVTWKIGKAKNVITVSDTRVTLNASDTAFIYISNIGNAEYGYTTYDYPNIAGTTVLTDGRAKITQSRDGRSKPTFKMSTCTTTWMRPSLNRLTMSLRSFFPILL